MTAHLAPVRPEERPPPASIEAEKSVIGAILLREEVLPEAEELRPDDFYLPANRHVWEAILAIHKRGRKVDVIAVTDELRVAGAILRLQGGESYVLECAAFVTVTDNVGHYARIVKEKAALRRLIAGLGDAMARAYGGQDLEAALTEVRETVSQAENVGTGYGPVRIGTHIAAVLDGVVARANQPGRHSVMTGISRFDVRIGGLRPSKLIVVAAPPGLGKSAWAGGVAVHNALRGVPSLIVSLEMERDELIERFLAGEARVENKKLGTGKAATCTKCGVAKSQHGPDHPYDGSDWKKVYEAARSLHAIPLDIDDREGLRLGQAIGTVRRWYAKHLGAVPPKDQPPKLAFVAVDYLQILGSDHDDTSDNRATEIGRMTKAFKRLAKTLRIPIVILSQLSRAWAKRQGGKPELSDLRESGSIEQDADMVVFPWREWPKDEEGREIRNKSGEAEWIIAKNRGGPMGRVPVFWASEYTRFENLEGTIE